MMKRLLTIGVAAPLGLAIAISTAPYAAAADNKSIEVDYGVWAGGLHAFSLKARMVGGDKRYRIDASAKTEGLIGTLFSFAIEAKAEGQRERAGEGRLRPETYGVQSVWSGKDREVKIRYPDGGDLLVDVLPPPENDNREPVPPELLVGTVDPMTAIFTLMERSAAVGRCEGEVAVFDGRRRYDLVLRHVGPAQLTKSSQAPYEGPATECRASLRRIAGFWKRDKRDRERENREVRIFMAPLIEGELPVPVRMTGRSSTLGLTVIIHALDARLSKAVKEAELKD